MKKNSIIILGATATGKTKLAVKCAELFNGEIISADSRQVYCELDIGSGKDLQEYKTTPYHLIDICSLDDEFNVFTFQKTFYTIFNDIQQKEKLPIICGGTGLYIDSIVRNYQLIPVPENSDLRNELKNKSIQELGNILLNLNPNLHNKTDLEIYDRAIRAIEIAMFKKNNPHLFDQPAQINFNPAIFGVFIDRNILRKRIRKRLIDRINSGMIEEVQHLLKSGIKPERLISLGLEYKLTTEFLQNKFNTKNEYIDKLYHAICKFAKRQETWFRRMEKNGVTIIHLDGSDSSEMIQTISKKISQYN